MDAHTWHVQPACGVECRGLALTDLTPELVEEVKRQFTAHGVVYFRDIGALAPDGQLAFARHFGSINTTMYLPSVASNPAVCKVVPVFGMRGRIRVGPPLLFALAPSRPSR